MKNLTLSLYFNQDVPYIIISDPNKIRISLSNLVDNAIKYTNIGFILISVFMKKE
jgi:signal transduction histidine kinase